MRSAPTRRPILTAPTLLDSTITSPKDSTPWLRPLSSLMTHDPERDPSWVGIDPIVEFEDAFLEGRRCRDDFERRARLIDVLNRPVAFLVVAELLDGVGVECRVARQREDFAGAGIHDDGCPAGGVIGFTLAANSRSAMCCSRSSVSSTVAPGRRSAESASPCAFGGRPPAAASVPGCRG